MSEAVLTQPRLVTLEGAATPSAADVDESGSER